MPEAVAEQVLCWPPILTLVVASAAGIVAVAVAAAVIVVEQMDAASANSDLDFVDSFDVVVVVRDGDVDRWSDIAALPEQCDDRVVLARVDGFYLSTTKASIPKMGNRFCSSIFLMELNRFCMAVVVAACFDRLAAVASFSWYLHCSKKTLFYLLVALFLSKGLLASSENAIASD